MILITGGAYQGKCLFAKQLISDNKIFFSAANDMSENVSNAETMTDTAAIYNQVRIADEHTLIEDIQTVHIWDHYHLWVAEQLRENNDPWQQTQQVLEKNPDIIICSTELGCGIVPIEEFDRNWREVTGRLCCMLAKEAKAVYRVNCGIGMQIK